MPSNLTASFKLLDGAQIPWIGWGNGSGRAREKPVEAGTTALAEGFRHIDTAQGYNNEPETNETLKQGGVPREEVWLTSKRVSNPYLPVNDAVLTDIISVTRRRCSRQGSHSKGTNTRIR